MTNCKSNDLVREGIKLNKRHDQNSNTQRQSKCSSFRSEFGTLNEPSPPRLRNAQPDPRPRLTSTHPACPPRMASRELRCGRCCSPAGSLAGDPCQAGGRANQPSQLQRLRPGPGGFHQMSLAARGGDVGTCRLPWRSESSLDTMPVPSPVITGSLSIT